jgi:hypothetical protein
MDTIRVAVVNWTNFIGDEALRTGIADLQEQLRCHLEVVRAAKGISDPGYWGLVLRSPGNEIHDAPSANYYAGGSTQDGHPLACVYLMAGDDWKQHVTFVLFQLLRRVAAPYGAQLGDAAAFSSFGSDKSAWPP